MEMKDNPDLVLNPVLPFEQIDFYEIIAGEMVGDPTMKCGSARGVNGGLLMEMCRTSIFKKGKNVGKTKWLKDGRQEVVVTKEALEAFKLKWQAETGRCTECYGNKLVWAGWHKGEGRYYRKCKKCEASVENT